MVKLTPPTDEWLNRAAEAESQHDVSAGYGEIPISILEKLIVAEDVKSASPVVSSTAPQRRPAIRETAAARVGKTAATVEIPSRKIPVLAATEDSAAPSPAAAKAIRRAGKVPATIYGRHQKPQSLQLDARALAQALSKRSGEHIVVNLDIDGGAKTLALIQDMQQHPVKRHILRLDFHALKEDEKMHTTVPVIGIGEPAGVTTGGGLLEQIIRSLEVECLPKDLPDLIAVDASSLNIGDTIHVRDIALPAGVIARSPADAVVFHCAAPAKAIP